MAKPSIDQGEIPRELGQSFMQRPATMEGQGRKKNIGGMKGVGPAGPMGRPSLKGSPLRGREDVNMNSTFSGSVGFNT